MIGPVDDASVLDLFAGSGSLGMEALSRGARRCTFVESDRAACRVLEANRNALALTGAVVVQRDALPALTQERARRRWKELSDAGADVKFSQVHEDIRIRDRRDRDRAVAPLRQAADAILLDTTDLDIEGAFRAAVHLIAEKTGRTGRTR